MQTVILTVHILACLAMIGLVLIQKSEGGALGIGGGGGGIMTSRGAAGALVRFTMIFGGIFFLTSLGLNAIANRAGAGEQSGIERVIEEKQGSGDAPIPLKELDPTAPLLQSIPATPAPQPAPATPPGLTATPVPSPATPTPAPAEPQPTGNPQ